MSIQVQLRVPPHFHLLFNYFLHCHALATTCASGTQVQLVVHLLVHPQVHLFVHLYLGLKMQL